MAEIRKTRLAGIATLVVIGLVLVLGFALGGGHSSSSGGSGGPSAALAPRAAARSGTTSTFGKLGRASSASRNAGIPLAAPTAVASPVSGAVASSASGGSAEQGQLDSAVVTVTATRVVKTGSLDLQVSRGQVQAAVTKLVALTTGLNGYVSQSRTDNELGSPEGEVTLRIPADHFETAVTRAEALGHVTSLVTNAHDVTGQYVDLGARLAALQRTRSTYLTILGRATTIGSTLEVQQRVNDVQQQIEQLQGQLKVLRNQSADGTLTVDVTQSGAKSVVHKAPRKPHGIGAAWHRSINRFARGFDAIVGALGPLVLAVLVLGLLAGIGGLGYRGVRKATG
ncbi:MAG TPA: DUF4349 domain-containing protein [Mycobacteriales bacterium]|jgi:hypothetical protein|nr:DUF4349 domain-containing protein [Mycobacteriales bacterium]